MSHFAILLPFGLPPTEIAADLFRELQVPALATLLSRARSESNSARHQRFDDFHRALPHEIWLAREFGLAGTGDTSPPLASALMRSFDLPHSGRIGKAKRNPSSVVNELRSTPPNAPDKGTWFIVQPVHIHIARDHLVLTDPRQLQLSETHARALFEIAQPLFEEAGKPLLYGDAGTWFARADDWATLQTATPDAAAGHNIDIWMPKGTGERDWRKLQNEVQMHWFTHPLNADRAKPVNSIWLWGGASVAAEPKANGYTDAFNLRSWARAFEPCVPHHAEAASAKDMLAAKPQHAIAVLDDLLEPALANDWGSWLQRMQALEANWFAPMLAALRAGEIEQITLIATHDTHLARFAVTRSSLRKFWIKPSLAPLTP